MQDAIDLFLGNYVVEEGKSAPRIDRGWKYLLVSTHADRLTAVAQF